MEHVVLVDNKDKEIGLMEKLKAHQEGLLHRALSVFIFNAKNELLLQQRALDKYHSGGLWTNTCCSHPKPNENEKTAAERRLFEEMGIKVELQKKFTFTYKANVGFGLIENELDHVFAAYFEGEFFANPTEVMNFKWMKIEEIKKQIELNPQEFTAWFKIILNNQAVNLYPTPRIE